MKTRLLLTLTAFLLALSSWAYGTNIDGIYYILNNDNMTASVTYTGTTSYPSSYPRDVNPESLAYKGTITIPSTVTITYTVNNRTYYKYYAVTAIGNYAFYDCKELTSVTIPNSVKSIDSWTFCGCINLTSITIPNSVTSIGESAFSGCTGLTSITIPSSVTSIGRSAFFRCTGLTSITIPSSVTSIGDGAFNYCIGLTSITIPYSVTTIGQAAFAGCKNLTSITIPNSVTSIGQQAFIGCTSLKSITIPNSVKYLANGAFRDCSSLESVTIGNSVPAITESTFYQCWNLKEITLGSSVKSIDYTAFRFCSSLKSITLPKSLKSIGYNAFGDCTALTEIVFNDSLETIGHIAFSSCTGLTEVILPNSVTDIGGSAFSSCTGLTSVTLPNSATNTTNIGDFAFGRCYNLRTITIGKSVKTIGDRAFYTEGGDVNNIFLFCTNPPSCSVASFVPSYETSLCAFGATLHVPIGTRDFYMQTAPWNKFKFIVDDLPSDDTETQTIEEVTIRTTAGDPMTFDDFKALAETGKHFAIVASSENSLVYPKWFSFATDGYPNILTSAQLFDLENSATGEGWYNIKRVSDNLYVSTEGGNFDAETKMDFKLVNRLAGDYWSGFSDASLHISLDNAEGNHYNANTVNLGFRSGTGGYSTYVAYGPFCVVTVNYLDKNDNPLKESETFIVKEGTTLEAPTIFGKVVQGTYSVVITEDQTINFKYDDSTFDYKVIVNSAIEGMTITIKGDVLSPNQTDYSNNEAVSESDVEVSFPEGEEFISYKVSVNGRTITIDCDDARWPINFYKWQTFVRTDRHINGVSFNDQTVDGLYVDYRTTCYQNLTSSRTVTLPAETTVKPSFNVLGQWMHGFVYIDLNNDGDFTDEGELVSYINKDNPNLATDLPNFTTPSTEGTYRMRVKTDWASLDPGGNIGADATNIYSNNHIIKNGGAIIDLKLVVNDTSTSINPISCARTGETYYNLEGQRIATPQRGQLVIVRYSDGTSRKMLVQ